MSKDTQMVRIGDSRSTLVVMAEDTPQSFARVTMDGERFQGGRVPVDSLEELVRYQKLVLAAAKQDWLDENPGDELPAEFDTQFELSLTGIEPGSAISVLERPDSDLYRDNFYRGRDEVEAELARAADTEEDLSDSTLIHLPEFEEFGSSLQDGEFLAVVRSITEAPSFKFTQAAHERVVLAARKAAPAPTQRETVEGWIAGRLIEINTEKESFKLETVDGHKVLGKYKKNPEVLDDLKAALGVSEKHPVIRLLAKQRVTEGVPKYISSVSDVQVLPVDGKPWSRRMIELAHLRAGWDEEASSSQMISFPALESARNLMEYVSDIDLERPGLFPHYDGGVTVEWAWPDRVFSIEIDPSLSYSVFATAGTEITVDESTTDLLEVKELISGAGLR